MRRERYLRLAMSLIAKDLVESCGFVTFVTLFYKSLRPVLPLARRLGDGLGELQIGYSHFSKNVQIRRHNHARTQVHRRRKTHLRRQVIRKNSHRKLTLPVRLLVDRRGDRTLLKIRRHLRKKVRGNESDLARQSSRAKGSADRQAIHCVH